LKVSKLLRARET